MSNLCVLSKKERFELTPMVTELMSSGAVPKGLANKEQVWIAIQRGKELGMPPVKSLQCLYFVNGTLTMWGSEVIARLKRSGYKVLWKEVTADKVSLVLRDPDGDEHPEEYTMEEAKAGPASCYNKYTKTTDVKDTYKKYPKNMLRYKCIGNAIRFFCPEVLDGIYITEEMDDKTETIEKAETLEGKFSARKAEDDSEVIVDDVIDAEVVEVENNESFEEIIKNVDEATTIESLADVAKKVMQTNFSPEHTEAFKEVYKIKYDQLNYEKK
jgi:hypothetical protein